MTFLQDLRYAVRNLRKSPGFFFLAVTTLALGMAANGAIFSLFYQVLLRSLPVREPDRLIAIHSSGPNLPGHRSSDNSETVFSYSLYKRLRDQSHSFQGLAARSSNSAQIEVSGNAERARAEIVTGNFFDVLGLRPEIGRLIGPGDDTVRDGNPVTVLSYGLWVRRFGASPSVLNQKVIISGHPFTIVGVTPEAFRGVLSGDSPELYVPMSMRTTLTPGWEGFDKAGFHWLTILGRLAPGVTRQQAQAELQPIFTGVIRQHIDEIGVKSQRSRTLLAAQKVETRPAAQGLNELERQWRQPLLVLLAMVGLLLLIAAANLANLLLARGVNRSRETAVRLALGASHWRIVSMLLAESLCVAIAGTLGGILLASPLTTGILYLLPANATSGWLTASVDGPVLAFCALLMIVTTLIAGLAPAWQASRTDAGAALGDRSATGAGKLSPRLRQALVAGQIAFSIVLLAAAGLFGRSLTNLLRQSPGFRADHLLTFSIDPGLNGYDPARGHAFFRDLTQRLKQMPGVESVSLAHIGPLSGSSASTNISAEGFTPGEGEDTDAEVNSVGADYFRTLGTPLIAGREFDERDRPDGTKVAIVNEAFAKRFFGKRNPIGMHMARGAGGKLDMEIVGVVKDIRTRGISDAPPVAYYTPYQQESLKDPRSPSVSFFVRGPMEPTSMASSVRSLVKQMDRSLPVYSIDAMETRVTDSIFTNRLLAALASTFGLLAITLTAIGLYGVISYVVSRRTSEIGVRMALGADRSQIVGLVLREVGWLAGLGGVVGVLGAVATSRAIEAQLFGMRGLDALVLTGAVVALFFVAACAGAIPAFRATRIEPLTALRHD